MVLTQVDDRAETAGRGGGGTYRTLARHPIRATRRELLRVAGGRRRARALFLLACVLALDTADVSTIGAIAGRLEPALSLSNTELGLLVAVPALAAAVATVPVGVLTDRVNRVRLMSVSVLVWGVAMVASGLTGSFGLLLVTRVALGAANATAGPTVSSLTGDLFAPRERGRVYGLILSGELLGAGLGFVLSGELAALSWRAAFFALAVPSAMLAVALWRLLPEPERGGASRLAREDTDADRGDEASPRTRRRTPEDHAHESVAQRQVELQRVDPNEGLVLRENPARMGLWMATRYVLRIPTNVVLIVSSALGYFYLAGVQTFGVVYFRGEFGVSQSSASLLLVLIGLGGIAGVVAGGRLADRLLRQGVIAARILVAAASTIATVALFLPALLLRSLGLAMPLFVLAGAAFAARNPALDAARLDIMHHRLWGRAEAVRTLLRQLTVAIAPLLFGFLADQLASRQHGGSAQHGFGASASAAGLKIAFLILLVAVVVSGILTLRARRTYPVDVATAVASENEVHAVS
jgi:predicted MFS family arabinose efflux permease